MQNEQMLRLAERLEKATGPDEDRLITALDDVERALKTKGIWGRHFALNALRQHFGDPAALRSRTGDQSNG